mmetsp:Transcript_8905/g.14559  ORF Transcript_8905/g.14559 Transcript_8905/m.14559 type:complete len:217 (-) Transcript_8905:134-784(-)
MINKFGLVLLPTQTPRFYPSHISEHILSPKHDNPLRYLLTPQTALAQTHGISVSLAASNSPSIHLPRHRNPASSPKASPLSAHSRRTYADFRAADLGHVANTHAPMLDRQSFVSPHQTSAISPANPMHAHPRRETLPSNPSSFVAANYSNMFSVSRRYSWRFRIYPDFQSHRKSLVIAYIYQFPTSEKSTSNRQKSQLVSTDPVGFPAAFVITPQR